MDENFHPGRSRRRRRPGGWARAGPPARPGGDRPSLLAAASLLLAAASRPESVLAARRSNMRGGVRRREETGGRSLGGKARLCPTGYTGTVPTEGCGGYVACSSGEPGTSQACAAGTAFDMSTGGCNFPDAVDCRWGDELEDELGSDKFYDGDGEDGDGDGEVKFCPPMYTGRAPTTGCKGYVQCNAGKEGLSAFCPPNTKFDRNTQQCGYSVDGCEMLVDQGPEEEEAPPDNPLDAFCPPDYTGRAPIDGCRGFVSCNSGQAGRSRLCPSGTLFDVMTLACSYSPSVADRCEAVFAEPTPAPATRDELQERRDAPVGCPPGHTGNVALPGCEGYVYCQQGVRIANYTCNAGTLYDPAIQNCNWADSVDCDTTKAPSFAPTPGPSGAPSWRPTGAPVEFDRTKTVYYPDFSNGVCRDDGLYPPDVSNQYLFHDSGECCETYFPKNMDACVEATAPTPGPTREGSPEWYPDYANDVCRNDGLAGPHETNFFWTYADCCQFEFINTNYCLLNPPKEWYPHYATNSCRNDGKKSEYEYHVFGSMEECCRYDWLDYGLCITGGTGGADEDEDGGDDGEVENVTFYPDYQYNVCRCDGKNSEFEINFFTSYNDCCDFALINTEICRHFKSTQEAKCVAGEPMTVDDVEPGDTSTTSSSTSSTASTSTTSSTSSTSPPGADLVWYADLGAGFCRNDGARPGSFAEFGVCCKRAFPQSRKECRSASVANSGEGTSQGDEEEVVEDGQPAADVVPCPILNRRRCRKEAHCGWSKVLAKCGYTMGVATTTTTSSTTPPPVRTVPGYTHPYYPDLALGICLKDGEHASVADPSSLALYGSLSDCCRYSVLDTEYCNDNSHNLLPFASEKEDADLVEEDIANDTVNPYYPDYFDGLCKNDGNQFEWETVFDNLEGCCSDKYLRYKECMARSVT